MRVGTLLVALVFMATPAQGQEPPLKIDCPEILDTGRVRTDIGVEFLRGESYPLSGLHGNLLRLGVTSLRVGVGDFAEFQMSGVVQDFFRTDYRTEPVIAPELAGRNTHDFGDLVLATKLRLLSEKRLRPAIAFKFEVELPNASNESGLGNDETEFYARVLLAKRLGRARVMGELGLGILGNPVAAATQADVATYGAGVALPLHERLELVAGVNGRHGPPRIGNESRAQMRAGIRIRAAGLRWDVAGIAGLTPIDASYGLSVGLTYEFQAFRKKTQTAPVR